MYVAALQVVALVISVCTTWKVKRWVNWCVLYNTPLSAKLGKLQRGASLSTNAHWSCCSWTVNSFLCFHVWIKCAVFGSILSHEWVAPGNFCWRQFLDFSKSQQLWDPSAILDMSKPFLEMVRYHAACLMSNIVRCTCVERGKKMYPTEL